MKKKILMIFVVAVLITIPVFGATLPNETDAKELADKIITKISSGDIDSGFNLMKPYIPLSGADIDAAAAKAKTQLEQYGKVYGKLIGFEYIDSRRIGDSLVRIRYVVKAENTALTWIFIFYKGADGWALNNFEWQDKAAYLFEHN